MPDAYVALTVSRDLLRRYREHLLEPLTLEVRDALPHEAEVARRVQEHGLCRLLVAPDRYHGWKESLTALEFARGEFDPVGRRVVCLRP
jgi:hypothetical protein